MIWLPSIEQIIQAHQMLIAATGGSDGIRDPGLIESALMRAYAGFGEHEIYTTVPQKAAAICSGLIGNHGFVDGNKRIGILIMLSILRKNGYALTYTQDELIELGLAAAQSIVGTEEITRWIEAHHAHE